MAGVDPNVQRRWLGLELRKAREAAGVTQRAAAKELEWSLSKLIRIETGAQGVSVTDLKALVALYGVTDSVQVGALTEAARGSHGQTWWNGYRDIVSPQFAWLLGAESQGASLRVSRTAAIPGLLHTEAYAAAYMGAFKDPKGRVPRIIRLRMERQKRFFGSGAESAFIVGEEALRGLHAGPGVMRRQFEHLLDMGQRPNVTIQIVPLTARSYGGFEIPFTLLQLHEPAEEVLYIESITGDLLARDEPELIAEFAEYFAAMSGLALSKEDGEALLAERIAALRLAEGPEASRTAE